MQNNHNTLILKRYRIVFILLCVVIILCFMVFTITCSSQPSKSDDLSKVEYSPETPTLFTDNLPKDQDTYPIPLQLTPYETSVSDSNIQIDDEIKIDPRFLKDFVIRPIEILAKPKEEENTSPNKLFVKVEEMPLFNGGNANSFRDWIQKNIKYPEIASENGISGNVLISFTINTIGEVCEVKVLRGVDPTLDKEAVRVISSSPRWTPGKQGGRIVKVQFNFPVRFVLQN